MIPSLVGMCGSAIIAYLQAKGYPEVRPLHCVVLVVGSDCKQPQPLQATHAMPAHSLCVLLGPRSLFT
jgi:hypothetical protein